MQTAERIVAEPAEPILDIARFEAAPLMRDPYDYIIVSDFIRPEWQDQLIAAYPHVERGGSFPLPTVEYSDQFGALIEAMNGADFRHAVEKKFEVDLEGKPTMFTVRGRCRTADGKIHTDSETKILTVLLYMNPKWQNDGGRLRLLRSGTDLNDFVTEVSPSVGTLLIFRRGENSWHGHLPFEGERKVIQMNWVTNQRVVEREQRRHSWSAFLKKLRG